MNIVRELRKKKGISQTELAIEIGVSNPTVSDWEHNRKDPSGERLKKLAQYFEVDELVVLGKSVISYGDKTNAVPKTVEAKIVSFGMDKLPKEQREQILNVVRAMFANNPDLFKEGDK